MWQDMGIYWAWRGKSSEYDPPPPSKRTLKYANVSVGEVSYRLAVKQIDEWQDGRVTEKIIHQDEVQKLINRGCIVEDASEE